MSVYYFDESGEMQPYKGFENIGPEKLTLIDMKANPELYNFQPVKASIERLIVVRKPHECCICEQVITKGTAAFYGERRDAKCDDDNKQIGIHYVRWWLHASCIDAPCEAELADIETDKKWWDAYRGLPPKKLNDQWLSLLGFIATPTEPDSFVYYQFENDKVVAFVDKSFDDNEQALYTLKMTDEDGPPVNTAIEYVHHLQALIWNLERVWLTLSPETP